MGTIKSRGLTGALRDASSAKEFYLRQREESDLICKRSLRLRHILFLPFAAVQYTPDPMYACTA